MKLLTFERPGAEAPEIGAIAHDGRIAVLDRNLHPAFSDMLSLIEAGEEGLAAAGDAIDEAEKIFTSQVRLLAPVPCPPQMRDALTFEMHLRQARANRYLFGQAKTRISPDEVVIPQVWYDQPIYYKGNRFSVSGPEDEILWPFGETKLDYELELGIIIGKEGSDIAEEDAMDHVFGFLIFNDFSARDHQIAEMQGGLGPSKGKDFRTANAMGPWLVTRDEIGDGDNLTMVARINGEEWSRGNSSTMHHSFARIIAHVSRDETLYPGEFIGSGTVGGGCGLELGRFLNPGDVVELEIEGLGTLRNRIGPKRG
ncbi:fumarylacetoacetate hydrolase family protein [Hoeflea sp. WL0058]|uniref:Fumarylacetoacetate hydrolase family protein n=1 Tax=Flavimaribacter sediminis TaxID=2865987 RepID=A0AAE2ZHD9_9HYPH|nr:fumarylacetoacetate hydrolase family protein [Flavimaribacter sediminis]MBW8636104.1 fumarylacetoacetate hydrolase family protein [Flavimaribacter sediminis]